MSSGPKPPRSHSGFTCEPGEYGTKLVVTGPWSAEIGDYLTEHSIKELELNHAKGWRGTDLGFLRDFKELVSFTIIDFTIENVSPIHELGALRQLDVNTYCKTPIDFSSFPRLEKCALEWRRGAESIFDRFGLGTLFINKCPAKSLGTFSKLVSLRSLSLASPKLEDVGGGRSLVELEFLGIYRARNLAAVIGIEELGSLRELELNDCQKIRDISPLHELRRLRRLLLCNDGEVASIEPLEGLKELEEFLFYESTNVLDGDLSPLKHLPRLRNVTFMDRKHYSHRRAEFPAIHGGSS